MQYGMVIDLSRCVGCNSCTLACKVSNGTPPAMFFSHVDIEEQGTYPDAMNIYTPTLCMHCTEAPCVENCPTGASYRDENGIVRISHADCIGCQACVSACPYGARTHLSEDIAGYYPEFGLTEQEEVMYGRFETNKVYKCDFCRSKGLVDSEQGPACVQSCPGKARIFGDLDDPNSEVSQLIASGEYTQIGEEFGTSPNVYYLAR